MVSNAHRNLHFQHKFNKKIIRVQKFKQSTLVDKICNMLMTERA